jgi:taurine dioxygenase
MALSIRPLSEPFGAEVRGCDLSHALSDAEFNDIKDAFVRHSVLLFREQDLTKAQHVALSRRFGNLELHVMREHTDPEFPEIFVLGSVQEPGGGTPFLNRNDEEWHSDSTFMAEPSLGSLLYCRVTPTVGGDTLFASTRAAYESLPPQTKRLVQGREVLISYRYFHDEVLLPIPPGMKPLTQAEKDRVPDVSHPLVRLHPESAERSIFVSTNARQVSGLDQETGRALIEDLCRHITRPGAVYRHKWQVADLVIWDNRCTMHTATVYDFDNEPRLMHRTTIAGDRPRAAPPEAV